MNIVDFNNRILWRWSYMIFLKNLICLQNLYNLISRLYSCIKRSKQYQPLKGTQTQWEHSTCCQHSRTNVFPLGSNQPDSLFHPGSISPPPRSSGGSACGSSPLLARCRETSPSSHWGAAAGSLLLGIQSSRPDFQDSNHQVSRQHTASCSRSRP